RVVSRAARPSLRRVPRSGRLPRGDLRQKPIAPVVARSVVRSVDVALLQRNARRFEFLPVRLDLREWKRRVSSVSRMRDVDLPPNARRAHTTESRILNQDSGEFRRLPEPETIRENAARRVSGENHLLLVDEEAACYVGDRRDDFVAILVRVPARAV